jgi:hypothetical protein
MSADLEFALCECLRRNQLWRGVRRRSEGVYPQASFEGKNPDSHPGTPSIRMMLALNDEGTQFEAS